MRLLAAVTVVVWVGVGPWVARAAAADEAEGTPKHDDPKAAEARAHYEEGTKAYNLGEYPRAVTEFKAAYNAKPDPLLLYNIAQSFRLGGDAAQALFFYRSFLRNMPTAPNRKEVEGRVRTLEKQVEKQAEKQADEPKHEAAPPPVTAPPPPVTSTTPTPSAGSGTTPPPPGPPSSVTAPAATAPAATTPPPVTGLNTAVEPAPAGAGVDLTQAPSGEPVPHSSPFYKKWWFWTGVGVVVLVGIGAAAAAARDKPPSTTYGLHNPTFTP